MACRKSSLLRRDVAASLFVARYFLLPLEESSPAPPGSRYKLVHSDQGSPGEKEIIFWKCPDLELEPHLALAPGRQQTLSFIPGSHHVLGFLQPAPTIDLSRRTFQSPAASKSCFQPEIPLLAAASYTAASVSFENSHFQSLGANDRSQGGK